MSRVLVLGAGATGAAVTAVLRAEGARVVVADDDPNGTGDHFAAVVASGAELLRGPFDWSDVLSSHAVDLVVPSPGVHPDHPLVMAARVASVPIRSEIDLAAERITAPIVAITGTNGKTTVTELVARMLTDAQLRVDTGGNIGTPLVSFAGTKADVVVAEVSSFQLEFTTACWRPRVATLLNIADDHLDWHGDRANYEAAKAKVFANQAADDVLVADLDDPTVARLVATARSRVIAIRGGLGDTPDPSTLTFSDGSTFAASEMPRALPHDRTNARFAAATAMAAGASAASVRNVLRSYRTLAHRIDLVGRARGVSWYDDSKATNPHATNQAVRAFDSVVLCAGGLNKGLDLTVLASNSDRIRAVVAFGDAGHEVGAAFAGILPVEFATSMDDVVERAARFARRGDAVLLSPACASFDAYENYSQRGDDFARAVRQHLSAREPVA
jgi:UDP-N-acetylmuramoylalanine--D-glutamate ligase